MVMSGRCNCKFSKGDFFSFLSSYGDILNLSELSGFRINSPLISKNPASHSAIDFGLLSQPGVIITQRSLAPRIFAIIADSHDAMSNRARIKRVNGIGGYKESHVAFLHSLLSEIKDLQQTKTQDKLRYSLIRIKKIQSNSPYLNRLSPESFKQRVVQPKSVMVAEVHSHHHPHRHRSSDRRHHTYENGSTKDIVLGPLDVLKIGIGRSLKKHSESSSREITTRRSRSIDSSSMASHYQNHSSHSFFQEPERIHEPAYSARDRSRDGPNDIVGYIDGAPVVRPPKNSQYIHYDPPARYSNQPREGRQRLKSSSTKRTRSLPSRWKRRRTSFFERFMGWSLT